MRSRSVLIAAVAAATTLALVVLKQPKTVALASIGSSPRQEEGKIAKGRSYPRVPSHPNDIAALLNTVETALSNPAAVAGFLKAVSTVLSSVAMSLGWEGTLG